MAAHQSFSGSQYADMQYLEAMSRPPGARFLGGVAKLAYGFAWVAVFAAAVGGAGLALYRNDALLSYAQQSGKELPYLEWERRVLGAPGWGTPRSVKNVELSALALPSGTAASEASAPPSTPEPSTREPSTPEPSTPEPSMPSLASAPAESEREPPGREAAPAAVAANSAATVRASRTARTPSSPPRVEEPAPARQPARKSRVAPREVEDEDDGEPVSIEIVDPGPRKSRRAEAAAEAEPEPEPPKPVAPKKPAPASEAPKAVAKKEAPPPAADDDNPLKAAIRSAILADQSGK